MLDLEHKHNDLTLGAEEIEDLKAQLGQIIDMIKTGKEQERSVLTEIYEALRAQFAGVEG